jgi:release factor glutamine methyltransferase
MPRSASIRGLLVEAEHTLAEGPHPERARLDAEALLLHAFRQSSTERNRAWLLAHDDETAGPAIVAVFRVLIARRRAGEPVQYIVGEAEFYGLPFRVTRNVLIPRPETEHLVEKAIELAGRFVRPRIADVGTGSGAIAVALAARLPQATVTATDRSGAALDLARSNAARNGVGDRIRFLEGDLLAPVAEESFEIVVSNPPYVAAEDRDSLAVEVRDYEPPLALFGGRGGLEIYRRLIPAGFAVIVPGGFLALEIGHGQQEAIGALLAASGFHAIEFTPDLQGIPRVAAAQRA